MEKSTKWALKVFAGYSVLNGISLLLVQKYILGTLLIVSGIVLIMLIIKQLTK